MCKVNFLLLHFSVNRKNKGFDNVFKNNKLKKKNYNSNRSFAIDFEQYAFDEYTCLTFETKPAATLVNWIFIPSDTRYFYRTSEPIRFDLIFVFGR